MKTLSLLLWLGATVALVFTFIGMLLFVPFNGKRSSWMQMGVDLAEGIKNGKGCNCNCGCCGPKTPTARLLHD